jgi:hypothetical protein
VVVCLSFIRLVASVVCFRLDIQFGISLSIIFQLFQSFGVHEPMMCVMALCAVEGVESLSHVIPVVQHRH